MASIVTVKRRLSSYARLHALPIPKGYRPLVPIWGGGSRELAKTVSSHMRRKHGRGVPVSKVRTWQLVCELVPGSKPRVHAHHWKWSHGLGERIGPPPGVVWHHAAAVSLSVERLDELHKANGWSGIGYSFYVTKAAVIHAGRPLWAMAAHAVGHNDWLGVCAEGNYDVEREMDTDQLQALIYLHRWLQRKYGPKLMDRRHRDMSGNATACPGRYYDFARITER